LKRNPTDIGSTLEADLSNMSGVPMATVRRVLRVLPTALSRRLKLHGRAGIRGVVGFKFRRDECDSLRVHLHESFKKMFLGCVLMLLFVGFSCAAAASPAFVPTPILVGNDSAKARIVVYDSLTCPACALLEKQIRVYKNFLIRQGVAVEFRLLSVDDTTMRRNAYVLYQTMHGVDALTALQNARGRIPSKRYAAPAVVRKWMQWYEERADADHVYKKKGGIMVARTPTSFLLIQYRPVAMVPPGIADLELVLAPLYDLGYLKEEFHGR